MLVFEHLLRLLRLLRLIKNIVDTSSHVQDADMILELFRGSESLENLYKFLAHDVLFLVNYHGNSEKIHILEWIFLAREVVELVVESSWWLDILRKKETGLRRNRRK